MEKPNIKDINTKGSNVSIDSVISPALWRCVNLTLVASSYDLVLSYHCLHTSQSNLMFSVTHSKFFQNYTKH